MKIQHLLILITLFIFENAFSQAPEMINYQAVVRDASGNVVNGTLNGPVGIQLTILKGSSTGTESYKETFNIAPNTYGLVNLKIGTGTVVSGTFSAIDWGIDSYWIKTEYDINGGTTYTISGTSQFLSVPYAIYANSAGSSTAAIIADSDGDTQIQTEESNDEDVIRFDTDGQERMVINSNGKIGIGTDSPSSYLEIKSNQDGALTLNKDGSTTWNYIQYKNSGTRNFYTGITNLEKFVFGSDNGEPFYFTGSNVGVSLNDPQANLDVQDVIRVSRENRQYTEIVNSSAAGAMIQAVSGEGNKKPLSIDALYEIETSPAAGANQIRFRTGEKSSPSIKMLIDEDGDVGIGATQPGAKLDVRGDVSLSNPSGTSANLKITNNSSNQYSRGSLYFVNANTSVGADNSGFSINYEKADASSTGNSTVIFRQGEGSGNYLDYLQFSETTKNITFNANKSSGSSSTFGNVKINQGNLELNTGAGVNEFSTDGSMTDNSDNAVPTEKAVKTYVDNSVTTADGSETILNAGTNVSITGTGTSPDPYVINSTDSDNQTIAQVLSQGSVANDGQTLSIDQINAIDGDGLKLYEDAGKGIFIEDGGNVGIGTSTNNTLYNGGAKTKLEVVNSVTNIGSGPFPINWGATLTNASNSNVGGNSIGLKFKGADYTSSNINKYAGIAAVEDDQGSGSAGNWGNISLSFFTVENPSSTTAPTEKMRINAQGFLGIGTTTPSSELDVNGDATISGNLGIGTTTPSSELEVNGDVTITGLSGGSVDMMVVANSDGDLSTQAIPVGASNLGDLSDGSYGLGEKNVFLGTNSGNSNTIDGDYNVGLGYNAIIDLTSGLHNTAIGYASQFDQIDGSYNTSIGSYSMIYGDNSNIGNTSIGYASMRGVSGNKFNNSNYNNAIGYASLYSIVDGDYNNAVGSSSLRLTTSGIGNNAIGRQTLYYNTDGDYNVAIGHQAGYGKDLSGLVGDGVGDKSVFIGFQAGYYETGSNKLYISNSSTSNPLIKGDFSTDELEIKAITKIIRKDGNNFIKFDGDASGNYITSDDPGSNQKPLYISANPSSSATKPIYFRTNNSTRLTIHGDGNIGIGTGTTAPSAKLQVSGDVLIEDQLKYNYGTPSGGTSAITGKVEKVTKLTSTTVDVYEDDFIVIQITSYGEWIKLKAKSGYNGSWVSSRLPWKDDNSSGSYAYIGDNLGQISWGSVDGAVNITTSGYTTASINMGDGYSKGQSDSWMITKEDGTSPLYRITKFKLTSTLGFVIVEAYYN